MPRGRVASALVALSVVSVGCGGGGENPVAAPALLEVMSVTLTRINPVYPERDPQDSAVSLVCHVDLEVAVAHPNGCMQYTTGPNKDHREGSRFVFFLYDGSTLESRCGPPVVGTVGLCLPGDNPDGTPQPPLPAGTYTVEVNGVTTSFDIP